MAVQFCIAIAAVAAVRAAAVVSPRVIANWRPRGKPAPVEQLRVSARACVMSAVRRHADG